MNAIKVLLADDHSLFRAGVHALLSNIEGADVVGEADTGRKALEMVGARTPDKSIVYPDSEPARGHGAGGDRRL